MCDCKKPTRSPDARSSDDFTAFAPGGDFVLFDFTASSTDDKPKSYWLNDTHFLVGDPPQGVPLRAGETEHCWCFHEPMLTGGKPFWTNRVNQTQTPTDEDWLVLPHKKGEKVSRLMYKGKPWPPVKEEKDEKTKEEIRAEIAELDKRCKHCQAEGVISKKCEPGCPNFGYSPSTYKPLPHFVVKAKEEGYKQKQELENGGPKTLLEVAQWVKEGKQDDVIIYATHNPKVMALLQEFKETSEALSRVVTPPVKSEDEKALEPQLESRYRRPHEHVPSGRQFFDINAPLKNPSPEMLARFTPSAPQRPASGMVKFSLGFPSFCEHGVKATTAPPNADCPKCMEPVERARFAHLGAPLETRIRDAVANMPPKEFEATKAIAATLKQQVHMKGGGKFRMFAGTDYDPFAADSDGERAAKRSKTDKDKE